MPVSSMHFITLRVKHETALQFYMKGQQTEILEQGPEIDNQGLQDLLNILNNY